jgi:predicted Zn-ribbon and HTH transcriptional regulator
MNCNECGWTDLDFTLDMAIDSHCPSCGDDTSLEYIFD